MSGKSNATVNATQTVARPSEEVPKRCAVGDLFQHMCGRHRPLIPCSEALCLKLTGWFLALLSLLPTQALVSNHYPRH